MVSMHSGRVSVLDKRRYGVLLIFLISVGVYIPSLGNGFVWDDIETIESSYYIYRSSNLASVIVPAVSEHGYALYYRPLVYASMVIDKSIWGVSEFGFHLTNIVLNAAAAVVFYLLAYVVLNVFGAGRSGRRALLAGVLFALYPMHVESVSWVSGRTDILCGLFFFLAFIFHVRSRKKPAFLFVAGASFALSLLSKETAVVFPVAALVFDLLYGGVRTRSGLIRYSLYLSLLAVYFYLRGRAFVNFPELSAARVLGPGEGVQTVEGIAGFLSVIKTALGAYSIYITKLFFPFRFSAYIDSIPAGAVHILFFVAALIAMCAATVFSIMRRQEVIAFSLLWILATLLPTLPVALTGIAAAPAAERYLYIPSAGLCMLAGYCLASAWSARPGVLRAVTASLAFLVVVSYLSFTILRQGVWKDSLSLWEDTVAKSPASAIPHINYGMALLDAGRHDEALGELMKNFAEGVRMTDESRSVTANNIGVVYIHKKDLDKAERWFVRAYGYDPDYYKTNYHLGLVNFMKAGEGKSAGPLGDAVKYLEKALRARPDYGKAYLLLAMVYEKSGDRRKARENARLAVESGLTESLGRRAGAILGAGD